MKPFENILFVAQPDTDDSAALRQAVALARTHQARLTVAGVVDSSGYDSSSMRLAAQDLRKVMVNTRREELEELLGETTVDGTPIEIRVLIGRAYIEIIREVLQQHHDIVIASVGPSETGRQRLFAGTLKKLLRQCPCPLWLIKSQQTEDFRTIMACVDFEPDNPEMQPLNTQILQTASALASAGSSTLHVVHAWDIEDEKFLTNARLKTSQSDFDALLETQRTTHGNWLTALLEGCIGNPESGASAHAAPQPHLIYGDARSVIPDRAQHLGADLVVMGTVARSGIPGFLIGNTAEEILDQLDCSVLAIKPEGFVSPVS